MIGVPVTALVHRYAGRAAQREPALGWAAAEGSGCMTCGHGCATLLLAQGIPDRVIMEVLGHAEIGVAMKTYAHVLLVLRQEAADAIDELFGAWRERLWQQ